MSKVRAGRWVSGETAVDSAINALASWARDLAYEDIPDTVIDTSKLLMLDGLGVSIAATADPVGQAIIRWAVDHGAAGPATAIGVTRQLSPADAALVNGTLAHTLDYDDHGFGGHGTACVLPAILAAAQAAGEPVDGRRLLTAYVTGMEAFGRLATCLPVPNVNESSGKPTIHEYGFHPTAVLGLVGATVGAAKVLGLSADQLAEAVTVGSSWGAGFTASFGTMVKPLHAGHTAASAVQAVQLALSGFTGNRRLFEADEGFGSAYTHGDADWDKFKTSLEGPFRLEVKHPSIKQYPCCGGNQRSIQNLARIMRDNELGDQDVAKVDVHVTPRQLKVLRYSWPSNCYEAKFCLPFTVAVTLAKGAPTLAAFRDEAWNDEQVENAHRRVEIITDGTGTQNQVTVTVATRDGRSISNSEYVVHGSAGDPMTQEEVSAKYVDCGSYGKVPAEAVSALHDATLSLGVPGTRFWSGWEAVGRS